MSQIANLLNRVVLPPEDPLDRVLMERLGNSDVLAEGESGATLSLSDGSSADIPRAAVDALIRSAEAMAKGHGVAVVPVNRRLTAYEAEDLLGIPAAEFDKAIDDGSLNPDLTGRWRRVDLEQLLDYQADREDKQLQAVNEMTRIAQELGMYDMDLDDDAAGIPDAGHGPEIDPF